MSKSYVIGIDLGTTNSCVAVPTEGGAEIIANQEGDRTTPSCVAFTRRERLVGKTAKENALEDARNSLFDMKRLIGRTFSSKSVQDDIKRWPFKVVQTRHGTPHVQVHYHGEEQLKTPQEVSAMVLMKLKEAAMEYLDAPEDARMNAVISVPAYFNNAQRQATKEAAQIAGLSVLALIHEPTAAGLAYGWHRPSADLRKVLIFDLGGGTFDVTILTVRGKDYEVLATRGDTHLGGRDFDSRMEDYFLNEFEQNHGRSIADNENARGRLRDRCEHAKHRLSTYVEAPISVPSIVDGIDFTSTITRACFEDLCEELFRRTVDEVRKCLVDAELKPSDIDEIVLVGGSTRIPKIRELLSEFFEGKSLKQSINADEAVAYGAAIRAAILADEPHESFEDVKLVDVTPLSLGIEVVLHREVEEGIMSSMIKRNTPIPVRRSAKYTTTRDNQEWIRITAYEGERVLVKDNHRLGSFRLGNIQRAKAGVPDVVVTFELDTDGILHVTAEDQATKSKNEITIEHDLHRLSDDELERMIEEAASYEQKDKDYRALMTAKNQLEAFCLSKQHNAQAFPTTKNILGWPSRQSKQVAAAASKAAQALEWVRSTDARSVNDVLAKHKELTRTCDACGI